MTTYEFTFAVENFDIEDTAALDTLYEHFNDVGASSSRGHHSLDFLVDAPSQEEALLVTYKKLRAVFPDIRILRVERDIVNVPEIAERLNKLPENIYKLISGDSAHGPFPRHVATLNGGASIWEWSTVYTWLKSLGKEGGLPVPINHEAATKFDAMLTQQASQEDETQAR